MRIARLFSGTLLFLFCAAARGDTLITLTPDEQSSKDVFVYEFDVPGFFGIPTAARTTNLDTATLSQIMPPPVPFGNFLGASETDPFSLTPGGPLRQHGTRTLIQFDLKPISLSPDEVGHAFINLYALPALPAFESPSPEHSVTTDLRPVTESWGEQTVTWENWPEVAMDPTASIVQSGVNQWVRFDVTDLVKDWLDDPSSNLGVQLSQRDVVDIEVPGARDRYFASLYASSASADPSLRPYLSINTVPEPGTWTMLALGGAACCFFPRRRK